MRICLLTGGGYPYRRDALGGWCRTVVEGLSDVRFDLVTVTDREPPSTPAYPLPQNVASVRAVTLGRTAGGRDDRRRVPPDDAATAAAILLFRGLLGEPENADAMVSEGLRRLARGRAAATADEWSGLLAAARSRPTPAGAAHGRNPLHGALATVAQPQRLVGPARTAGRPGPALHPGSVRLVDPLLGPARTIDPLAGVPLAEVLQDAWRTGRSTSADDRLPLPRLSVRDARTAATLLRHAVQALAAPTPAADLVHCVGGTMPLLAALAGHWRRGTPLLLTEARAPVARLRPAEERLSPAVRTVLRRFRRAVARTGYAEAGLIAPLSAYHHGWALRHGARPGRLVSVPAGVDPLDYATAPEPEVAQPAVVWAGSGGPDSGLDPLLAAFGSVVARVPGTVLHLVGVTAAHEDHCAEQIEHTGLGRAVRLHPLPADPRDRYAAGHVVVHVPGPADPPYRLIEAMMSGRAVVGVDVGPAAETLGDAGVLVPAGDPAALAEACVAMLRSPGRRRALGEAARRRALAYFTTDRVVRVYDALYTDLAAPPPAPAYELTLSVPAPRTDLPATMRWLIREDR
jgi:polysaccharide biosynthesis protein PelF